VHTFGSRFGTPQGRALHRVAEALDVDQGSWTLQVRYKDGRYERAYRHHGPISGDELERRFGGNTYSNLPRPSYARGQG
jgi:hypothetical protein